MPARRCRFSLYVDAKERMAADAEVPDYSESEEYVLAAGAGDAPGGRREGAAAGGDDSSCRGLHAHEQLGNRVVHADADSGGPLKERRRPDCGEVPALVLRLLSGCRQCRGCPRQNLGEARLRVVGGQSDRL